MSEALALEGKTIVLGVSGSIAAGASAYGPYVVTVTASDSTYTDSKSFTWNVANPIVFDTVDDQTSAENATPTLTVSATGGGTLAGGVVTWNIGILAAGTGLGEAMLAATEGQDRLSVEEIVDNSWLKKLDSEGFFEKVYGGK